MVASGQEPVHEPMIDAITTWLRSLPRKPVGEIVVPATIEWPVVEAIVAADFVPMFVDVRPGLYVAEAEYLVPALCQYTAGVILPWTHGNAPDMEYIPPACAVYDVPYWAEPQPETPIVPVTAFRFLYDAVSTLPNARDLLPQTLVQHPPRWTCLPLLAPDAAVRDRVVGALLLAGFAAQPMRGAPSEDERAQLGTHGMLGTLPGARDIGGRGFTVPLVAEVADVLVEALS